MIQAPEPWRWRPSFVSRILAAGVFTVYLACLVVSGEYLFEGVRTNHFIFADLRGPLTDSLWIAGSTAVLCGLAAPPLAWAIRRLRIQSPALRMLMIVPFCLPSVAVGGMLVLAFGNFGLANKIILQFAHQLYNGGGNSLPLSLSFLYQSWSPLLGTVWMNLSLGILLLVNRMDRIPEVIRFQVEVYGLSTLKKLRLIIIPYLVGVWVPWLGLVFLACFNSFGLMLTLGGPSVATTLEIATWRALFLDGNWASASAFMLIQLAVSLGVLLLVAAFNYFTARDFSFDSPGSSDLPGSSDFSNWSRQLKSKDSLSLVGSVCLKATASLMILFAGVFYFLPFAALIYEASGFFSGERGDLSRDFVAASLVSLENGFMCSLLVGVAVSVLVPNQIKSGRYQRHFWQGFLTLAAWVSLVIPGMLVAVSMFHFALNLDSLSVNRVGIWLVQALGVLPAAFVIYGGGWAAELGSATTIKEELGLSGFQHFLRVEAPTMGRWLGVVLMIGFSLSVSDITVVTVLSSADRPALTQLIFQLMGSYQFVEASLAVLVLVMICMGAALLGAKGGENSRV